MKSFLSQTQINSNPVRVVLAALISGAAFMVSPVVISAAPFAFPMWLGPILIVAVPTLALLLCQRRFSLFNAVIGSVIAGILLTTLNQLLIAQMPRDPWLSYTINFVTFVVIWYGALLLCSWLAQFVVQNRKHGQRARAFAVAGGIVALVVAGLVGLQQMALHRPIYHAASMSQGQIDARKTRIVAIYNSLGLSSDYRLVSEDVFGEKRVYSWDNGRSFSSSRSYVHEADVDATVAELRPLIEKAGFEFVGEPYPGAIDQQLHFRSAKGEYIRLTVSSKPRDDALQATRGKNINYNTLPYREGPSNVLIKVNLDDNNE